MADLFFHCPYYSRTPSMQYKCSHYLNSFSHHAYTAGCLLGLCSFVLSKKRGPILVAPRFKARVFGRSLAGIVRSNPAGEMDACFL